jgi:hypothetical protein
MTTPTPFGDARLPMRSQELRRASRFQGCSAMKPLDWLRRHRAASSGMAKSWQRQWAAWDGSGYAEYVYVPAAEVQALKMALPCETLGAL